MLDKCVENLYSDSEADFRWDIPCLVTSKMTVNSNTQFGKVIEIETVTPVSCSIQEASTILWKGLKTVHEIPGKRYRYLRGSKPNSLENIFFMTLRGQQRLEFRSPSWTTIAASESDPLHASIVRSYLRIYAEVQPDISARREDVDCTRDFVLTGLSKMMYGCAQKTQSEIIQKTLPFILHCSWDWNEA
ncbi:hypothetical protein PHYPSEUDO_001888 [Phytophthora pseudosyringae]|uniref:Uncharacterized protein n=1 Tax=Phytophthora pseudosyringae TaxID=221518 RepID=A0A8T1WG66_9STRA|nr:hypothetical protein PHYPSEUDO_001888 [Phytophthora pseudosyringae]